MYEKWITKVGQLEKLHIYNIEYQMLL
jgi:hypothetical protein